MEPITIGVIAGSVLSSFAKEISKAAGKDVATKVANSVQTKGLWPTVRRAFIVTDAEEELERLEAQAELSQSDAENIEDRIILAMQENKNGIKEEFTQLSILQGKEYDLALYARLINKLREELSRAEQDLVDADRLAKGNTNIHMRNIRDKIRDCQDEIVKIIAS